MVKIYHFRRNCTVPLDHPCKITRENGSKHDTILLGPECQWKFELFYCRVFNKNERIMQAKGLGLGKFLQNELLKSTISSNLSKTCVLRPINKCKIFYFSAVCHALKPILLSFELHSSLTRLTLLHNHTHIVPFSHFVWLNMPGYSASVDRSAGLYTVKSCI